MKFESTTKVGTLYRALPSAWPVVQRFGISADCDFNATLAEIAEQRNFDLNDLIHALEGMAWEEEAAPK